MSTLELKEKLISQILRTESKLVLAEISRLLELEEENSEVVKLTPRQKEAILQGQEDIQNGRFLSGKEADDEILEWLKE